jgi:hypothetical protein
MSNQPSVSLYLEETTVRLVAAQVVLVTGLVLFTHSSILAFALALDFTLRAFSKPATLGLVAKGIFKQLGKLPIQIFAPPKRFAAGIGASLSLLISFLLYFELNSFANFAGGILIFFALLESVFKICAGCYVYDWFIAPFFNKN